MLTARSLGLLVTVACVAAACGSSGGTGKTTGTTGSSGVGGSHSSSASVGGGTTTASTGATTGSGGASTGSTSSSTGAGGAKECPVFLASSPWNTDISDPVMYPVSPLSDTYIKSIGLNKNLHPDFGTDPTAGIPYQYVNNSVAKSPVDFSQGAPDESDPGPYPIPASPLIEGGGAGSGDAHMLMVQTDECVLYELYLVSDGASGWSAYSGAIWDLKVNAMRPQCWTSADAAGLPIYPGLARYEEVAKGAINHALRFTASSTQKAFAAPATHFAGSADPTLPPMGLRVRLKANYDISTATPQSKIILTAMKQYGLMLADNGSSWFVTGAPDPGWDDNDLDFIKTVPGSAFEALPTGPLTTSCP